MTRTNYRHACGKSKKEDADVPKRIFLLLLIVLVTITGANAQEGNPKEEIRPETKKPLDANLGEQLKPGESVLDANLGDENDQKNSYPRTPRPKTRVTRKKLSRLKLKRQLLLKNSLTLNQQLWMRISQRLNLSLKPNQKTSRTRQHL